MKERPILFSAPMVRALLAGMKTQTRRVVKMLPMRYDSKNDRLELDAAGLTDSRFLAMCPYGVVGDQLWVRETFAKAEMMNGRQYAYRATGDLLGCMPWKPSIHMPRAASRITLEIVSVRIERLHEISEGDALAVGIKALSNGRYPCKFDDGKVECLSPVTAYASLWSSINGADSWASNPWVWVVEFKVVKS